MAASMKDTPLDRQVIVAWVRIWGLHQLAPFANAMLGITGGAIDNWPLREPFKLWHWRVRLPCILISMLFPSPAFSFVAHLCNLAFLAATMPFVWDHMVWASLQEIAFVAAMLSSGFAASPWAFLAAARTQTIISYMSAAFWKLNTSFLKPQFSCGSLLTAELLSILPGPLFAPQAPAVALILHLAPIITIVGEFAIPVLLMCHQHVGILLGIFFHLTILMLPVNAAGGFSLTGVTSYFFFVPRGMVLACDMFSKSRTAVGIAGALLAIAFRGLHGTADATFGIYLFFTILLFCAICLERKNTAEHLLPSSHRSLCIAVGLVSVCHGFLAPMFGLQQMAALTMYGNLQHWGRSNHLIAPTSILQNVFADVRPSSAPLSAFAGGAVRIDTSDLPKDLLRTPADATKLVPKRVRDLLASVNNPGIFYAPYYARMAANDFFDDIRNEGDSPTEGVMDWRVQPFAVPAFELRRLLALARERGEPFMLRYTPLPREARTPGEWMRHDGLQVFVQEDPANNVTLCAIGGGQPCTSDELALLPPPPKWLAKLLLPYPVPLIKEMNDTELLCIS